MVGRSLYPKSQFYLKAETCKGYDHSQWRIQDFSVGRYQLHSGHQLPMSLRFEKKLHVKTNKKMGILGGVDPPKIVYKLFQSKKLHTVSCDNLDVDSSSGDIWITLSCCTLLHAQVHRRTRSTSTVLSISGLCL